MTKAKRNTGFTLVEMLVAVLIMGVLAAVALPNFVGAIQSAASCAVKGNMRTVQIAAEGYAVASGGGYAADCSANGCGPYFPGGSNALGGAVGTIPMNPVSGTPGAIPASQSLGSANAIAQLRNSVATGVHCAGGIGGLTYDQADAGTTYAVTGGDANGYCVAANSGKCLVLSNE